MKKLGIIFYIQPNARMLGEGLSAYLEKFISAAINSSEFKSKQVSWSIVCPDWAQIELRKLLTANGTDPSKIQILSPPNLAILTIFKFLKSSNLSKIPPLSSTPLFNRMLKYFSKIKKETIKSILLQENIFLFVLQIFFILPSAFFFAVLEKTLSFVKKIGLSQNAKKTLTKIKHDFFLRKNFCVTFFLETVNTYYSKQFSQFANAHPDILGWYAPMPLQLNLNKPLLMCFPDNVFLEFPFGFSDIHGLSSQAMIHLEKRINSADCFATYSKKTKYTPLISYYNIDEKHVFEIPTPAIKLDNLINITGFKNNEQAKNNYCKALLKNALSSSSSNFLSKVTPEWSFIFYSSRFRPNKNVITLLRAYEFLLRKKYIKQKLILTGSIYFPDITDFIINKRLENDVVCLGNISQAALAACYYLADLAVNPTLSEGGFPFTFSEALTTGTPVVMSKIQVVEEVITQKEDQELMLFDPYNFKDMARAIEYGIKNPKKLFERQKKIYEDYYSKHTWENLVQKHEDILLNMID